MDVATAYSLVSNAGLRPPLQSAQCWNKHSHVLVFTVPAKVQEGPHKPNLLPGRAHLPPNSGRETQARLWFVQTRGRAGTWLTVGTRLVAGTPLTALRLLSAFQERSRLRLGCHGTVRLLTRSSLQPEQKKTDESQKEKERQRGEQ